METWETVITGFIGGMGLLLYGMYIMSEGLQKVAGHRLRTILGNLTRNRFAAVLVGIVLTVFFQSSTATTVILVGLANASIITLQQSLGVILGAGIGTTVTAQLIALKVTEISFPIVGIGATIIFFAKRDRYRRIGQILLGFGLLFLGLQVMATTMQPLKDEPLFRQMLLGAGNYPLLAIIGSTIFTFLVHSSAAAIGIIMIMAMQGLVSLHPTIYLILGANIGTSFTALLSSLGSSREAQRVAIANFLFKIVIVVILLPFITPFANLITKLSSSPGYQAANAHTLYNIFQAILFLPFINQLAKLLKKIFPDKQTAEEKQLKPRYLDERFITKPAIGLGLASKEINNASDQVYDMICSTINIFDRGDVVLLKEINGKEEYLDMLCKNLTNYLTQILRKPLSREEFNRCMSYMNIINDLENIGDIIERDITHIATSKITNGSQFSQAGWKEIQQMHQNLCNLMRMANLAFISSDSDLAYQAIKNCPKLALMERKLRVQHFNRLMEGTANSIATSSIHLDLISSFLRMSEHINNICQQIITRGDVSSTLFSHHEQDLQSNEDQICFTH
ncbi:phosphate:Na+ symporter [Desulfotomaculum arcticum]|uniref:Phosphate:Na+ symporter n=1 Tax=Desulfotruncus arcticus DSM 17038 TaxID=1121424 RepID=A0A1I2P9G2_9FIRM|nr:Na/Pi cotransporter family protein [Desulfotruncus arcticus]SFG12802.1 phosphate:Na+ symporter [Desulfotomaculum arcticum] [Desulfotruncus arcticus DSM 17038]